MKTFIELFIEEFGPETKPREGDNSRHKCPQCSSNSLSCHIRKGAVRCFHCNWSTWIKGGESSYEPDTPVDRELQLKVTFKLLEISELNGSHRDYLAKRGIFNPELYQIKSTPAQVDKLLLNYFNAEELLAAGFFYKSDGQYFPRAVLKFRRILIPHWQGEKIIAVKSRIRPYVSSEEAREPKYAAPQGANVGKNLWWKGKMGVDAIVTEGELASMATNQTGITSCGLPGISSAQNWTVIQQIKQVFKETKRKFIILDTDLNTKNDPIMIGHALTLRSQLGRDSVILYLPSDYPNEPIDLDLYLCRHEVDELYELMENAWDMREQIFNGLKSRVRRLNERKDTKIS